MAKVDYWSELKEDIQQSNIRSVDTIEEGDLIALFYVREQNRNVPKTVLGRVHEVKENGFSLGVGSFVSKDFCLGYALLEKAGMRASPATS